MPAQITPIGWAESVGLDHSRHGVPAHVSAQTLFDLEVAGAALFLVGRNRVHVGRVGRERMINARLASMVDQLLKQKVSAVSAFSGDDCGQSI